MENLTEYYLEKLEKNEKFNIFFKFFILPQNPVFLIITAAILSKIELSMNIGIPSIIAVYIMWEYCIAISEKYSIAEKCVIDEVFIESTIKNEGMSADVKLNCPDLPMYVTEEEKNDFLLEHVLDYKNMNIIEKFKMHHDGLLLSILLYAIIYIALK